MRNSALARTPHGLAHTARDLAHTLRDLAQTLHAAAHTLHGLAQTACAASPKSSAFPAELFKIFRGYAVVLIAKTAAQPQENL